MKLFDRPTDDVHLDPAALDWIREHEPGWLGVLGTATLRHARWFTWGARISFVAGVVTLAQTLWFVDRLAGLFAPIWLVLFGVTFGFSIGISFQLGAVARLFQLLALLKGERRGSVRPAADPPGARPLA